MSWALTSEVIRYVAIAVLAAKMGARSTHMLRMLMVKLMECSAPWMMAAVAISPG